MTFEWDSAWEALYQKLGHGLTKTMHQFGVVWGDLGDFVENDGNVVFVFQTQQFYGLKKGDKLQKMQGNPCHGGVFHTSVPEKYADQDLLKPYIYTIALGENENAFVYHPSLEGLSERMGGSWDENEKLRNRNLARFFVGPCKYAFWNPERLDFKEVRFQGLFLPRDLEWMCHSRSFLGNILSDDVSRIYPDTYYREENGEMGCVSGSAKCVVNERWVHVPFLRVPAAPKSTHIFKVANQEIMTKDRVSMRLTVCLSYRIEDYRRVFEQCPEFTESGHDLSEDSNDFYALCDRELHSEIQLLLREFVSSKTLEEICDDRAKSSEQLLALLQANHGEIFERLCIRVSKLDILDIGLPREIKETMMQLFLVNKQSQIKQIERRDEVATTRSLLNTAKLLDENENLRMLKKLEYLEKICANSPNLKLSFNDLKEL